MLCRRCTLTLHAPVLTIYCRAPSFLQARSQARVILAPCHHGDRYVLAFLSHPIFFLAPYHRLFIWLPLRECCLQWILSEGHMQNAQYICHRGYCSKSTSHLYVPTSATCVLIYQIPERIGDKIVALLLCLTFNKIINCKIFMAYKLGLSLDQG